MTVSSTNHVNEVKSAKKWIAVAIMAGAAIAAYYVIYIFTINLNLEDSIAFRKLTTELNVVTLLLLIGIVTYIVYKDVMKCKWLSEK